MRLGRDKNGFTRRTPSSTRAARWTITAIALLVGAAAAGTLVAAEVKVGGLQVVGAGFGKDGSELSAFNSFSPGTKLYLVVDAGSPGQVVEILEDDCEVSSMADDTGKNLLEGVDWGSFPDVSEDKRYGAIELSTNGRPAAGAAKLTIAGTLAYQTSDGSDLHEIGKTSLTQGTELDWDSGDVTVGEVVESEWSDGIEVNLEMTSSLKDQIKEIRFYDAGGAQIETGSSGYMVMGNAATLSFSLDQKVSEVSLQIETWKGLRVEKVPFEVTVGLGI